MSGNLLKAPHSEVTATLEALASWGVTREDFTRIRTEKDLAVQIADLIHCYSDGGHIIDCDVDPFIPKGWRVEEHIEGGSFEWDPSKILLYLSADQKDGRTIVGHELRKELENKKVLNANVLDWLLKHTELIPKEWKKKGFIFFWGTIYRGSGGGLFVRYLCWRGDGWDWDYSWLDDDWFSDYPAAVLASDS